MTARVSRPSSTASSASPWPGRRLSKPNAERATRSASARWLLSPCRRRAPTPGPAALGRGRARPPPGGPRRRRPPARRRGRGPPGCSRMDSWTFSSRGSGTSTVYPKPGGTTMAKDHGPSVKDDEQYEALRREGASKEKAARIANAGDRSDTGRKGGQSGSYDDWTKDELEDRAAEIGIEGRSDMSKDELIDALRNH